MQSPNRDQGSNELRERFLAEMATRLGKKISPLELEDTISELRFHLIASEAAFIELGLDPVSATMAAIQRLGDTDEMENRLGLESRKARATTEWATWMLMGGLVGTVGMLLADASLVFAQVVRNPSPAMAVIGLIFGGSIGVSHYRRPRRLMHGALRAALIVPGVLLAFVSAVNGALPTLRFMGATFLAMGIAGFAVAALTPAIVRSVKLLERDRRPKGA